MSDRRIDAPTISSDPTSSGSGPFADLLRLQSDFQARLADETLRYLRRLQGALAPAAPGTVVKPAEGAELSATGAPGQRVELRLAVENRQRVHCLLTAHLTPLVDASGTTWFPATDPASVTRLIAPDELTVLPIDLSLPVELPAGVYRGALLLQGFRSGGIAVTISVVLEGC